MSAANALSGFIGHRDREQTIWTPPWFLDCVDRVFPDGWGDPYPSPGSPAYTRSFYVRSGYNALTGDWYARNFANPPYEGLKLHLPRMRQQWVDASHQTVALIPVRTRRDWWCREVEGAAVAYLKPVVFLDAKTGRPYECVNKKTGKATISQFPENLAAVYWGDRKALFQLAFAPHSNHIQLEF